jgi:hypothetical protein
MSREREGYVFVMGMEIVRKGRKEGERGFIREGRQMYDGHGCRSKGKRANEEGRSDLRRQVVRGRGLEVIAVDSDLRRKTRKANPESVFASCLVLSWDGRKRR